MFFYKKPTEATVDFTKLPQHIAIIMDGNRRWAKKHLLPGTGGHAVGAETFRRIATYAKEIGLHYLTVYAFSTENWKRPPEEVATIMSLLKNYLQEALRDAEKNQIRMNFLGDLSPLEEELRVLCEEVMVATRPYEDCQVNICLNYGARDEILRAAKAMVQDCAAGAKRVEDITEQDFSAYLYTADMPDPDLIIRPGGEQRLSNFLLWQAAYAEFYYTDVSWPDFKKEDLLKAIGTYQLRSRRFGGT